MRRYTDLQINAGLNLNLWYLLNRFFGVSHLTKIAEFIISFE
jgi:hypothetical protein